MVQPGPPTASGGETKPTCSRPPVATGNPLLRKRIPAGAQLQARRRGVTEPRRGGKKILACPLLAGMTAMCAGARWSPGPEIGGLRKIIQETPGVLQEGRGAWPQVSSQGESLSKCNKKIITWKKNLTRKKKISLNIYLSKYFRELNSLSQPALPVFQV